MSTKHPTSTKRGPGRRHRDGTRKPSKVSTYPKRPAKGRPR